MRDHMEVAALDGDRADAARGGLLEIGNTMVGLHKQFFGRGPTKARATLMRDALVVVLEGGFSQAEQTLTESGHAGTVIEARHAVREATKERWIEAVESLLGRSVRSFVSAIDPQQQIQVETFVLRPDDVAQDAGPRLHSVDGSDGSDSS